MQLHRAKTVISVRSTSHSRTSELRLVGLKSVRVEISLEVPFAEFDDLDGVSEGRKYPDGTVVRVFCIRTDRDTYLPGWTYKLHYGAMEPDPPRTLDDGTILERDPEIQVRG
ncbi:hypothetical protein C495_16675 [Natronorubrum sulfidifaciens JCM 14089]|uniref:Uncharacterized protein n=1 Tax=Natronorubrum sulfidifaciens JCM 14089 TaxID=1230460 RepID=L9VZV7_9EURY|nr:hypothetical protein C495_16675 [Natronorubrum sulfidifaciens JCM 14089]